MIKSISTKTLITSAIIICAILFSIKSYSTLESDKTYNIKFNITGKVITGLINEKGKIKHFKKCSRTDFIEVLSGDTLFFSGHVGTDVIGLAGYKAKNEKSFVKPLIKNNTLHKSTRIVIPEGINYVMGCARNSSYTPKPSIGLEIRKSTTIQSELSNLRKKEYKPAIIIEPLLDLDSQRHKSQFLVHSKDESTGKYITHHFMQVVNKKTNSDYGWYCPYIYHNSKLIAYGEFNWIHMLVSSNDSTNKFYDENAHVGISHGCEVFEFVKFFAGAKEFNPESPSFKKVIYADRFRMISKSIIYAAANSKAENADNNVFKLDSNKKPIPSTKHWMDIKIEGNNKLTLYNKLKILRDSTQFIQCHIGMLSCRPDCFQYEKINNENSTIIYYNPITRKKKITLPENSAINRVEFADYSLKWGKSKEGTHYLASAKLKEFYVNKTPYKKHHNMIFMTSSSANKTYFQPILTLKGVDAYKSLYNTTPNKKDYTFNKGDILEGTIVTEFSITK
ncbi:MAG: hypothetical protein ACEPOV_01400 [Hyphomicrobiales bacterium]